MDTIIPQLIQWIWPTPWIVIAIALGIAVYIFVEEWKSHAGWTRFQPAAVRCIPGILIAFPYLTRDIDILRAIAAFVWFMALPPLGKWLLKTIWAFLVWGWSKIG